MSKALYILAAIATIISTIYAVVGFYSDGNMAAQKTTRGTSNSCHQVQLKAKIPGIEKVDVFTTPNLKSSVTEFRYETNRNYQVLQIATNSGIDWVKIEFLKNNELVSGWVDELRTNCNT